MPDSQSAENLTALLVEEARERFSRIFDEKGFRHVPLPPDESNSELKRVFPLGRFKRKRGRDLEIVEVQFDRYGRPRLVINFGVVPESGVSLPWGDYLDQETADVSALSDAHRLYSSVLFAAWFQLGWMSRKNPRAIKRLVDKAILFSKEIDDWFEHRSLGKHMRKFGLNL